MNRQNELQWSTPAARSVSVLAGALVAVAGLGEAVFVSNGGSPAI
jgi:hypothetical protein